VIIPLETVHLPQQPSPVSELQKPMPLLSTLWALCCRSVCVVELQAVVVGLSVWLAQPLLLGLLYLSLSLYLPRLFVCYHCCAVSPPYPAAHRSCSLAVESSIVQQCMHFSSRIDQLQMLPRRRHFGSRTFGVRQPAGHHAGDHLEP
jgi:hypothetical protein